MKTTKLKMGVLSDYRAACYGFCAIWIVLFHVVVNLGCDFSCGIQGLSCLNTAFSFGSFGVDIFMLLSGVSCYFSWSKKCDAGVFLRKRLMRIVPSVLLICVPVWAFFVLVGEMHWTRLLYNALLSCQFSPTGVAASGMLRRFSWCMPRIRIYMPRFTELGTARMSSIYYSGHSSYAF